MRAPLGLILAGGGGHRLGGVDKAFVPLGGTALLTRVRDRFAPQLAGLAISANGDAARFADYRLPVLADAGSDAGGQGPLAGILAGLDWAAAQGAFTLVSVAVDTPFLPPDLVPRLLLAAEGMQMPLVVASGPDAGGTRLHPACGLWPVARREDLRAALRQGVRRLGGWAAEMGARQAFFADGEVAFFNINRPEDLARAEALLTGR
ncbi:molybdenum cofactor guanylyltransferase MobA [Pseudooceanicola sp.]|uniref:molybdenum cofactor guanylyltransferase MobA n=1 Tax=Pseudooceanicola sp. TaxID=1914328 RepID=UPI0026302130|nr:molybdenum cofactor guanylyltransferase MobA [Pseudooceanicola sp.]MDF1855328.1 molybdenum cofactor guanylyltransferase [Pseudooceanicola sp.]